MPAEDMPGWGELLRGGNAARSGVIAGGMALHALNTFVVVTLLPTVIADIGGLDYLAWNTTLYVAASLLGACCCARALAWLGPRACYRLSIGLFAMGTLVCALAPGMAVLLAGRLVQGLGAGTLSALSFSMIRLLFPRRMWPRAIAIVSTLWGAATLLGPALGGVFAQFGVWRPAFWLMLAVAPLFALLVERCLRRQAVVATRVATALPVRSLALLLASVISVSLASTAGGLAGNLVGVVVAAGLFGCFARMESGGGGRLMPTGACDPRAPMGAIYATQFLLLMGMATEIFVPYFLQTLHGMPPLHAGYLTAVMSAGWSAGSIASSGAGERRAMGAMTAGPLLECAGLAGLCALMPLASGTAAVLAGIGLGLFAVGVGIGLGWPHLGSRVYRFAAEGERDVASASLTVIVMLGNAFGSALAGLVTNMAGLGEPGGMAGAASAASWLFGLAAVAPVVALWSVARVRRHAAAPVAA